VEKFLFSHTKPLCAQAKGGPELYQHGERWKAAEIVGRRVGRAGPVYLVSWAGYDETYNTWEPRENILDASLIKDYDATVQLTIPLEQPMWQLREEVAKMLMGIKRPMQGMEVEVPLASYLEVARAVIRRATKPPSCRGGKPLEIEYDQGARWRTMQLQLEEPSDIAWLLQLQLHREGAYGCAIFKKGRGGNSNMTVLGGPLLLTFSEPTPRADGVFRGGASFTVTGNVWVFNGRDGSDLEAPGLPNATMLAPIREYLKNVLRGRARWGLKHRLAHSWAELSTKRAALTEEEAHPRRNVRRARAGPSTGGEAPPPMGALE